MTTKTTITPEFDHSTRTRTYRVTVAWGSGASEVHGLPTYEAAQVKGRELLAKVPAEQPAGRQRIVALVPVGRAGR